MFAVDDGTGTMTIFFERKYFEMNRQMRAKIDKKYRSCAGNINIKQLRYKDCPNCFPNPRPRFSYPPGTSIRDMAVRKLSYCLRNISYESVNVNTFNRCADL